MKFQFYYLDKDIFVTFFQETALHIAVEEGNAEIIKLLLSQKGINVNIRNGIFILF